MNNHAMQTLQVKLALVATGQQVSLTPEEAAIYGINQADIVTESIIDEEEEDGQR